MASELTQEELVRYSRTLIPPEIGVSGQKRLKAAKVLLVGAGGLGSPAALYLAASGVGTLGIVDFDAVDLTNLHRQVIHGTSDVGRSKLDSAAETISAVNPNVNVVKHDVLLNRDNAMQIIHDYDLIVDGTDNFATRYLINDACVLLGKTNVYGSILGFEGQASVLCARGGPCYRCLFPEPPPPGMVPSCAENGVLGVLPGIIGLIQSTEAVKLILGIGEPLVGRLLLYEALEMRFSEVRIRRDLNCPVCGENPAIKELQVYDQLCGLPAKSAEPDELEPAALAAMIERDEPFILIDVREPDENEVCRIPGSILNPLGQVPGRIHELDRSKKVVVHCRSGGRSAQACAILREKGFDNAVNLKGGIIDWMKSGGKVES